MSKQTFVNPDITVKKLTDVSLLKDAVKFIFGVNSKASLEKWYASEHSPSRTQLFAIFSEDTPYSVCMQMRTHEKNGALFIIEPGRPDTGSDRANSYNGNYREAPRNMFILCNAQHLIDWAHKRMCSKAEAKTRKWFDDLKRKVKEVDHELAKLLVPNCVYRNGACTEFRPCGKHKTVKGA